MHTMYSIATDLASRSVCDIVSDTRQLITGPRCTDSCTPDSCDGIENHPALNKLCDPRMGPRLPGEKCMYYRCGLAYSVCPGHPGRIVLARPCFAPHLIPAVCAILKRVCCNCRRHPAEYDGPGSCGPCIHGFTRAEWIDGLLHVVGRHKYHEALSADQVMSVLLHLHVPGLSAGIDRLVLTEIEVLPNAYRPYVSAGQRCYPDPLTVLYANVVSANNEVSRGVNKLAYIDLQAAVNCLFDSSYASKANAVSLKSNIGKKEGRIRQDLMGKRVDESARTVMCVPRARDSRAQSRRRRAVHRRDRRPGARGGRAGLPHARHARPPPEDVPRAAGLGRGVEPVRAGGQRVRARDAARCALRAAGQAGPRRGRRVSQPQGRRLVHRQPPAHAASQRLHRARRPGAAGYGLPLAEQHHRALQRGL